MVCTHSDYRLTLQAVGEVYDDIRLRGNRLSDLNCHTRIIEEKGGSYREGPPEVLDDGSHSLLLASEQ